MLLKRKDPASTPAPVVRIFRFGAQQWLDPDPSKSPEEIRDLLAEQVPQLTTCAIEITEEPVGKIVTFAAKTGTRGSGNAKPAVKQTVNLVPQAGKRG